jgi:hypothetical protein
MGPLSERGHDCLILGIITQSLRRARRQPWTISLVIYTLSVALGFGIRHG